MSAEDQGLIKMLSVENDTVLESFASVSADV